MKIKLFLFTLFVTLTISGFAQLEIKGFGGINASTLTNSLSQFTYNSSIGYQLGASVIIGKKWYLEPGVSWMNTNQEIVTDSTGHSENNQISTIRIPVFVGYRFFGGSDHMIKLRVFAGLSASFITDIKYADISYDRIYIKDATWGVDIGAGIDVLFLFLDVGYEYGLSNVFTNSSNSKNNIFYVNLGFRIELGK